MCPVVDLDLVLIDVAPDPYRSEITHGVDAVLDSSLILELIDIDVVLGPM